MEFYKLQASGNDFILIDNRKPKTEDRKLKKFAKKFCERKKGIGADGLLVIEPSKRADFKMRIFNADGSEAEMCGNGARCVAFWTKSKAVKFDTIAGIIQAQVKANNVKIKLTDPTDLKSDFALTVLGRTIKINYINSGVPHTVIFVQGLDKIDVEKIGRPIRFHDKFKPAGTNVDFVEVTGEDSINLRTYERGVEAETLACGTGAVASAIIASCKLQAASHKQKENKVIKVLTKSKEVLKVYFKRENDKISDVWLEGKAYLVYKGEII